MMERARYAARSLFHLGVTGAVWLALGCGGAGSAGPESQTGAGQSPSGEQATTTASDPATAGVAGPDFCLDPEGGASLFLAGWDEKSKAQLELLFLQQLAAVSYDCRTLRVLSKCNVAGAYDYIATTPIGKTSTVRDPAEAAGRFPLVTSAPDWNLSSRLAEGATLQFEVTTVGRYEAPASQLSDAQLSGQCQGATHLVGKTTLGAFKLALRQQGKADPVRQTAEGRSSVCQGFQPESGVAPDGCNALVGLELVPLRSLARR